MDELWFCLLEMSRIGEFIRQVDCDCQGLEKGWSLWYNSQNFYIGLFVTSRWKSILGQGRHRWEERVIVKSSGRAHRRAGSLSTGSSGGEVCGGLRGCVSAVQAGLACGRQTGACDRARPAGVCERGLFLTWGCGVEVFGGPARAASCLEQWLMPNA